MFERFRGYIFARSIHPASLLGLWERFGDEFSGCLIRVKQLEADLEGRVTYAPPYMRLCGWSVGDVKWRRITSGRRHTFELLDLYNELDSDTKEVKKSSYEKSRLYFVGKDEFVIIAMDSHRGRRTRWRRSGLSSARVAAEDDRSS